MGLLVFLLLFLVLLIVIFRGSAEGAKEARVHRASKKGKIVAHSSKNLKSFISKAIFKYRLVCVVGANLSGRTHLAKMIAQKHGYTYIDEHRDGLGGKTLDAPAIRRQFYVDAEGSTAEERARKRKAAKKYVISGCFHAADLRRLFKGASINKNAIIIFVKPDPEKAAAWSKVTKKNKDEYKTVLRESENLFKELSTLFLMNVVVNRYND
jgi:hypothetical protein